VWDGPAELPPSFLVTDNLLVDVQSVHERLLEAAALADGQERFKNNLWVALRSATESGSSGWPHMSTSCRCCQPTPRAPIF